MRIEYIFVALFIMAVVYYAMNRKCIPKLVPIERSSLTVQYGRNATPFAMGPHPKPSYLVNS